MGAGEDPGSVGRKTRRARDVANDWDFLVPVLSRAVGVVSLSRFLAADLGPDRTIDFVRITWPPGDFHFVIPATINGRDFRDVGMPTARLKTDAGKLGEETTS